MKNTVFTGVATAIVTPLNEKGIDFEKFGKLIDWQIEQGIDALVIAGTSGEASTLTDEEHREVIARVVKKANKRVPVIAGTGSNDAAYAVELTKYACEVGADAMLVVTPYYNKATQNGLIKLFTTIADASTKPIILYNVPSRTGVNIKPETYAKLAEISNIVAIKEASGDISAATKMMQLCGDFIDKCLFHRFVGELIGRNIGFSLFIGEDVIGKAKFNSLFSDSVNGRVCNFKFAIVHTDKFFILFYKCVFRLGHNLYERSFVKRI